MFARSMECLGSTLAQITSTRNILARVGGAGGGFKPAPFVMRGASFVEAPPMKWPLCREFRAMRQRLSPFGPVS